MNQHLSRRKFFRTCVPKALLLGGILSIAGGCGSGDQAPDGKESAGEKSKAEDQPGQKQNPSSDPCTDYSGLSQEDLKARSAMGYTTQSPVEEKQCNNCQLYLPPPEGSACGRCQLFKGPVVAGGYCTYWAPLV